MATQQVVVEGTETALQAIGQIGEICRQVKGGTLTAGSGGHLQAFIEHRDPFTPPKMATVEVDDRVAWWMAHYRNIYRLNPDFSGLRVPKQEEGFSRLIILPKGFKMRAWVEMAGHIHGLNLYANDLDVVVPDHDRMAEHGAYAIWIRDRQEADEELKNLSVFQLAEKKVVGITLPERLVADTAYLFETGRHMDVENWTLCAGSRYSDGSVPHVYWNSGARRVRVGWYYPGRRGGDLRARAVISLPAGATA